jgi:ABC-type phosphate transport system substrate-binding protein
MFRLIPLIFAIGFFAAAATAQEVRQTLYQRLSDGTLSTDLAQWDDEDRKTLFGNMPAEFHGRYIEAFAKLLEANNAYWHANAEVFKIIHPPLREDEVFDEPQSKQTEMLSGNYTVAAKRQAREYARDCLHHNTYHTFYSPPAWVKPEKQNEYWKALAEETLFLFDVTAKEYLKETEAAKKQADEYRQMKQINLKELPYIFQVATYFQSLGLGGIVPLNDAQKELMAKEEPLFVSRETGMGAPHPFVRFANFEYQKELRDAELERWRIPLTGNATPELTKLGIDQAAVVRWDASYSLHPLVRGIAERCEGIDMKPLETVVGLGIGGLVGVGGQDSKTLSGVPGNLNHRGEREPVATSGLMALLKDEKDVFFLARQPSKAELDEAKKRGVEFVIVPFAKDAIVFLQNKYNPVRSLTLEQYRDIFGGKYSKWDEIGGAAGDDVGAIMRFENYTSEELFQTVFKLDALVYERFKSKSEENDKERSFNFVRHTISLESSPGAIAYTTYQYDRYVAFGTITRTMAVDGVFPNAETIASGKYPLVYECVLVHRKEPGEKVERFVKWLLSDEGQKLVRSVGYVPIRNL